VSAVAGVLAVKDIPLHHKKGLHMAGLMRVCVACTQTDDHPRHIIDLGNGSEAGMHPDCCVMVRDCAVCKTQLADAKGAKGDQLREHLVSLPPRVLDEHGQEVS